MGVNVGSAYVTLMPSMNGFSAAVNKGVASAYSNSEGTASKSGVASGSSFSTAFAAKLGIISGLATTAFNAVGSAVSSSMSSAISRVDTLNQFPKVMQQMGFSAQESQASIDKLSAGIDGLPTSLDSIASSAQSIALLTGNLDGATNTAIALNDAFLASGSSSADAERGLQQYTQMLSKGSVDLESWRTLQETMGYALRETANAMGYTGDSAVNDLYAALQSGEVTFDEFNAKLVELDQATGGFGDTAATASAGIGTSMSNAQTAIVKNLANIISAINGSGAISGFFDGLKNLINQVGEALLPVATALGEALSALGGWISENTPLVAGLAAAFAGYTIVTTVAAGIDAFKLAMDGATVSQKLLNLAMSANPVGLVVAALAALIAITVNLWNTNEDFRNAVTQLWNDLQNAIGTAATAIGDFCTNAMTTISDGWTNGWQAVFDFVSNTWNNIKITVTTFANNVKTNITNFLTSVKTAWDTVWNNIFSFFANIWNNIKSTGTNLVNAVKSTITSVINNISSVWNSVWSGIGSFFSSIWNGLRSAASNGINTVYSTVTGIKSRITGFFSGAGSWLYNSGVSLMNGLRNGIQNAINGIIRTVSNAVSRIRSYFPFSPAKKGAFSGHGYTTYSGKALMGDFASSIKAQVGKVTSATDYVMAAASDGLSAQLTTAQRVSMSPSETSTNYESKLAQIEDVLNGILNKQSDVYMDGTKVSAALAQNSRYAMAGAGVQW